MRAVEGEAMTDRLVTFLYLLMRDELPTGKVEHLITEVEKAERPLFSAAYLDQASDDKEGKLKYIPILLHDHHGQQVRLHAVEGEVREHRRDATMTEKEAQDLLLGRDENEVMLEKITKAIAHGHKFGLYKGAVQLKIPWNHTAYIVVIEDEGGPYFHSGPIAR